MAPDTPHPFRLATWQNRCKICTDAHDTHSPIVEAAAASSARRGARICPRSRLIDDMVVLPYP